MRKNMKSLALIPLLMIALIAGGWQFSRAEKTLTAAEINLKWKTIEALEKKQQYNAAIPLVEEILAYAKTKADASLWTKALVRRVVLENVLHGYETSVKLLLDNSWPQDVKSQSLLNLYTANLLFDYYGAYSWEINGREKIATKSTDPKEWTSQDIFQTINERFSMARQQMDPLGTEPIGTYKDYIQEGNYPGKIRKTMRDFLVYRWVDLLRNTATWRPEQSQEKYKLSLTAFLSAPNANEPVPDLNNPAIHPLQKINYLLNEHYLWNQRQGSRESCLETILVKLECLTAHFTKENEKQAISEAYRRLLPEYADISWWSHGQYQLAAFLRQQGDPVAAHQIAKTGYDKYPDSIGGKECLSLMKEIEAPSFSMQVMASDRSNTRSIQISHANMTRLYFRMYQMDAGFIDNLKSKVPDLDNWDELRQRGFGKKPDYAWECPVPDLGDYQTHVTYQNLPVPAGQEGVYILTVSADRNFAKTQNQVLATTISVSSLVMILNPRLQEEELEVFVRDGLNGEPIPGAKVTLYQSDYNQKPVVLQATSDANGLAKFSAGDPTQRYYYYSIMTAEKGTCFTLYRNHIYLGQSSPVYTENKAFVYTDRSIYRPLQKVYYKVVVYSGNTRDNKYQVITGLPLNVQLVDPDGEIISTQNTTANSFGSASGDFIIPAGRILGHYTIRAQGLGQAIIRVEEYKRPTFEAKLLMPDQVLRLNQAAAIKGEVRYYFGMPVTEGKVKYRITRETDYPWWYRWYYYWFTPQPAREVAAGETDLDTDGIFQIKFRPEGDEALPDKEGVSYHFRITAIVTDSGGETKEAMQDYRIGFVGIQANIETGKNFYLSSEEATFDITRTNLSGTGQSGQGKYQLFLLKQPKETIHAYEIPLQISKGKHTEGDNLRPRWEAGEDFGYTLFRWEDGQMVGEGNISHAQDGKGKISLSGLKPGVYRLRYQTRDPWGSLCKSQKEFVVAADNMSINASQYLLAQKQQVYVGENLTVLLGTGFRNKPFTLEIWLGDKLAKREYRKQAENPGLLNIPIEAGMRGGFTLRLYLVEDYQVYQAEQHVDVPFEDKQLDVNFSTFRDLLRPGQKETWALTVKGPGPEKVSAEILAYMYDRSLDYFVKHTYPDPASLYRRWGYQPQLLTNVSTLPGLNIINSSWFTLPEQPYLNDSYFTYYNSYPVGGTGKQGGVLFSIAADAVGSGSRLKPGSASKMKDGNSEKTESGLLSQPEVPGEQPTETQKEEPLRANFAETAFFYPHLVTDPAGNVKIEFEAPDSVTSWNIYTHALTRDLKFMTLLKQAETRKELMIRPYLPRFFRENDRAVLKVVINNAGKEPMLGDAVIDIYDPETNAGGLADFGLSKDTATQRWSAPAGQSTVLTWRLKAPAQIKSYAFKIIAKTKEFTDGEVKPVPVLPSRMHLVQSKFVTLKDDESRELKIEDMEKTGSDPSLLNEKLVVTLDGQLMYTVLRSLPYLVNYPYECLEQTLNRFLSTSIVTSLYDQYPPLAKMARDFSTRKTRLEPWVLNDPNRKLALEETPWLQAAKGSRAEEADLINIFDTGVIKSNQESALRKLRRAQLPNGGFPWFEGGPASGYMTLYILYGFAKAHEFKVDVPIDMIQPAWQYLKTEYTKYYTKEKLGNDFSFLCFLNYVLSCFPEEYYHNAFSKAERTAIINKCFAHWKEFSPYSKALLALTLNRAKRTQDAKLVLESIMDSAVTKKDQGTFWAREERSWLWYNDQIESHAFILRTLLEISPQDPRVDGLALWLLINKKMNQWKSTRTTAEVIYSLAHYMKQKDSLAVREEAGINIGGQKYQFVFEPDRYSGNNNQVVLEGEKVVPAQMAAVTVDKKGKGFMFASMTWHYSTEKLPTEGKGDVLSIRRNYFIRRNLNKQYVLEPLSEGAKIQVGDQIEVRIGITCRNPMEYVHLHDPRAGGLEPENPVSGHHWDLGIYWYEEVRDSGANFFFEHLPQGEYTFKYRLRANMAGEFRVGPATIESMYAPEFAAFSAGQVVKIEP